MITCNLTKPEATFDQIRKTYKDLKPTDAALIATALVEAGRFALAVHDGQEFQWTDQDHEGMARSLVREVQQVQEAIEPEKVKKTAKPVEDEPVTLSVHLKPSLKAGETVLGDREDLKTLLSDIVEEGVEYMFGTTDIGWQWTLERINWATISGGELKRRVKFKPVFDDNTVGIEIGASGKRKVSRKASPVEKSEPAPVAEESDADGGE